MNRFYMYHSLLHFHRNAISIAAIFLAAKVSRLLSPSASPPHSPFPLSFFQVEEQPRKLDHVVRVAHYIQNRNEPMIDPKSEVSSSVVAAALFLLGIFDNVFFAVIPEHVF